MNRKELRKHHRALWNWLAENPGKMKWHWPGWKHNGGELAVEVLNLCFLCELMIDCAGCRRITGTQGYGCLGGLYHTWEMSDSDEEMANLARKIANLPIDLRKVR